MCLLHKWRMTLMCAFPALDMLIVLLSSAASQASSLIAKHYSNKLWQLISRMQCKLTSSLIYPARNRVIVLQRCMCDSDLLVKHSLQIYLYGINVSAQSFVHLDMNACVSVI